MEPYSGPRKIYGLLNESNDSEIADISFSVLNANEYPALPNRLPIFNSQNFLQFDEENQSATNTLKNHQRTRT